MATTIAVLTEKTGIGNLWRNGRRKKDGYRVNYVVRFLIERDESHAYILTPQPPCAGEVLHYDDMTHLKMYWEWWSKDGSQVDYNKEYA